MPIAEQFRKDADTLPAGLRKLLEDELAAGNSIAEVGYTFPVHGIGVWFRLTGPVTTRARESGGGLEFYVRNRSDFSGCFEERGNYFILEPPLPPEPEPDMDAIREAHTAKSSSQPLIQSDPNTALGRFERSMVMDYEKWHDGIGYDLDLLKGATPEERGEIEALLIQHGVSDWRDVEALAALGTPKANLALGEAKLHADSKIRLAVADYAPNLVSEEERTRTLVSMLRNTSLNSDLSKAIDAAADFHPPEVVAALLRGVQAGSGDAVVHFAALLMFIHGKADSPFDWEQRPFFLRFNTESRTERHAAFLELCQKIGVDPANYE